MCFFDSMLKNRFFFFFCRWHVKKANYSCYVPSVIFIQQGTLEVLWIIYQVNYWPTQEINGNSKKEHRMKKTHMCSSFCSGSYNNSSIEPCRAVSLFSFSEYGKYMHMSAPGETILNFGSKTSMPWTTRYSPGRVKAAWLSYWPTVFFLKQIAPSKPPDLTGRIEVSRKNHLVAWATFQFWMQYWCQNKPCYKRKGNFNPHRWCLIKYKHHWTAIWTNWPLILFLSNSPNQMKEGIIDITLLLHWRDILPGMKVDQNRKVSSSLGIRYNLWTPWVSGGAFLCQTKSV